MKGLHLRDRRPGHEGRHGFTIVELLIVVVVIAILAMITIVAYNGVSTQAKESALKSELTAAARKLQLAKVENGVFPTATPADTASAKYQYTHTDDTFCLTATNPQLPGRAFFISESGSIKVGLCPGHSLDDSEWTENNGVVTTIAGSSQGYVDGVGIAARFNRPYGMTIDSSDTLYIADTFNNRIRKISPSGQVTTVAGSGEYGFADGHGTAAKFANPTDVAVDGAGNVYVADVDNHRIRKITPAGQVTTLAGYAVITEVCEDDGEGGEYCYNDTDSGYADGFGTNARFAGPRSLVIDSQGNIFVSDNWNGLLRKVTPEGQVTTFAGSTPNSAWPIDGVGPSANFRAIGGLAIDENDAIYVIDGSSIRKVSPDASVTTIAGVAATPGWIDGAAATARFGSPEGIAITPSGNIYVADTNNTYIRKISPSGEVTTFAGSGSRGSGGGGFADGVGTAAMFRHPRDIVSNSSGVLYVLDSNNNRIRKIE